MEIGAEEAWGYANGVCAGRMDGEDHPEVFRGPGLGSRWYEGDSMQAGSIHCDERARQRPGVIKVIDDRRKFKKMVRWNRFDSEVKDKARLRLGKGVSDGDAGDSS